MESEFINNSKMDALNRYLLEGDASAAVEEAICLRKAGVSREQIIEAIEKAMELLDAKCTSEQFNLLEIMLAGRAAMSVMKEVYSGVEWSHTKGTVVIGALEGDVHDIGKNIVRMVLTSKGFKVIDCGKDCPVETIIDAAEIENAEAILISGLITTVLPQVKMVKQALADSYLKDTKVCAGGAALKQFSADELKVDFVGETAFDILHYLEGAM